MRCSAKIGLLLAGHVRNAGSIEHLFQLLRKASDSDGDGGGDDAKAAAGGGGGVAGGGPPVEPRLAGITAQLEQLIHPIMARNEDGEEEEPLRPARAGGGPRHIAPA